MTKVALTERQSRFQALLNRGMSRQKASRIINAEAGATSVISEPEAYADWTDEELYVRAGELGVEDRAGMNRAELISAIRRH